MPVIPVRLPEQSSRGPPRSFKASAFEKLTALAHLIL